MDLIDQLKQRLNEANQLVNAVTPPVMEWLVNRCVDSLES